MDQIKAGGGKATRTTFEGGTLKASAEGDNIVLTDDKGGKQTVTIADVIHVEFSWNSFFLRPAITWTVSVLEPLPPAIGRHTRWNSRDHRHG
jgi:hypothetical protein